MQFYVSIINIWEGVKLYACSSSMRQQTQVWLVHARSALPSHACRICTVLSCIFVCTCRMLRQSNAAEKAQLGCSEATLQLHSISTMCPNVSHGNTRYMALTLSTSHPSGLSMGHNVNASHPSCFETTCATHTYLVHMQSSITPPSTLHHLGLTLDNRHACIKSKRYSAPNIM